MYGAASNAPGLLHPDLRVNLFTRGDINPRHVSVIPTSFSEIPLYGATTKFFGNLFSTAKSLNTEGVDVSTAILRGLEHNGLSRPLAGLAQTLQGLNNPDNASFSTSRKGSVVAVNDLISLSNVARLVGGKPLDEAIALDTMYRYKKYDLKDNRRRQALGRAIKTTLYAGQDPTVEQITAFTKAYVEGGGKQENFNKWFMQLYSGANESQINTLQKGLDDPYTRSMQEIMGNEKLRDFTNQ